MHSLTFPTLRKSVCFLLLATAFASYVENPTPSKTLSAKCTVTTTFSIFAAMKTFTTTVFTTVGTTTIFRGDPTSLARRLVHPRNLTSVLLVTHSTSSVSKVASLPFSTQPQISSGSCVTVTITDNPGTRFVIKTNVVPTTLEMFKVGSIPKPPAFDPTPTQTTVPPPALPSSTTQAQSSGRPPVTQPSFFPNSTTMSLPSAPAQVTQPPPRTQSSLIPAAPIVPPEGPQDSQTPSSSSLPTSGQTFLRAPSTPPTRSVTQLPQDTGYVLSLKRKFSSSNC